jgi:hypothetical protein
MGTRRSRGSFFTNKFWKSGLIDCYRGLHVQVSLFLRIFVQGQSQAVCLFSSKLSNCDQTTHDGTVTWGIDQYFEAANGRGSGPHDQCPSVLKQLACRRRKSVKTDLTLNEEAIRMVARHLPVR